MKILAVSDRIVEHLYTAGVRQSYPDIELLLSCGDLPFYYLEFLVSAFNVPLLYVRGNHDDTPQYTIDGRVLYDVPGGRDVHGRVVQEKGLLVGGLQGSMRYRPDSPLMYTESEMRAEIGRMWLPLLWNRIRYGRALDILLAHSPPYRIHDRPDIAHTGFQSFRRFLRVFRPRYMLHGHIHVYRQDIPRVTRYYDTLVVNVYPKFILELDKPPAVQQTLT